MPVLPESSSSGPPVRQGPLQLGLVASIFGRFLLLGCTSFGGPAAHLGYFRIVFVERLRWLDDASYGRLLALSQFLPGPGSSQVGFALGLQRAGLAGGIAAFIGFTLPSFLLMAGLAISASQLLTWPAASGVLHGLKLLAVIVVADAVISMAGSFCHQRQTRLCALLSAGLLLMLPGAPLLQPAIVLCAAAWGLRKATARSLVRPAGIRWGVLAVCLGLMCLAFLPNALPGLFSHFYASGSLVFGGGHVVLPLLQERLAAELSQDTLLLGYAAAQAIPGPMFTLASFLGASLWPAQPVLAALVATLAIFLPGLMLVYALLPGWQTLAQQASANPAICLINASVVGILGAALVGSIAPAALLSHADWLAAGLGLFILRQWRPPIVLLVLASAVAGYGLALL